MNYMNSCAGKTLDGQYQIEAVLGQGGMGVVYLARHILLGDRVAIKVLPPDLCSLEYKQRFLREGQAARRIHHPNIVTVHDLRTTSDGIIYMVMEYVEGHTLGQELEERKRFSPAEALEVLEPIASALDVAHRMGVVHRDLKPNNIMIGRTADNQPLVKLLDLGLAKINKAQSFNVTEATNLTVSGQILGTPYYMPPEQWGSDEDGNTDIDRRADIYSLGIVFYELIAGQKPFNGTSLEQLAAHHALTSPPALHEIVADVPLEFSNSIARAMSKRRNERQATVEELIVDLRRALQLGSVNLSNYSPAASSNNIACSRERVVIKHLSGSKAGQVEEFSLKDLRELSMGRDPSSTVKYDPFKDDLVARHQCKIQRDDKDPTQFIITDLNSRNGTFVNRQKISGTGRLEPGSIIQFGPDGPKFEFSIEPPPVPQTRVSVSIPPTRFMGEISSSSINVERIFIRHLSGSKAGQVIEFSLSNFKEITIGREPSSILKYDPVRDDLVSSRHAKILWDSKNLSQFTIMDLHSRNGTYVNNQKVVDGYRLNRGDIIQLGLNGPAFEFNI
jgi:serine/threonine protein kinase